MLQRFIAFVLLLFACVYAGVSEVHGQTSSRPDKIQVTGRVVDTAGAGIARATIRLFAGMDTVRAVTEGQGRFSAYIARHPDSLLRIRIAHLAYDPIRREVRPAAADSTVYDFGRLVLKDRLIMLDEVYVENRPEIYAKGDTIFFETDHIRVADGAYTEDLMRRIPGMQVDGHGRLRYLGRTIEHVRLNGIDFFGGNVALALQNLPADLIRRLQLIEYHGEDYELTGIRSANPTHMLNLSVDDDNTRGKFSYGKLGYGTDRARVLNAGGNSFNKEKQASVVLGNNNLTDPARYSSGNSNVVSPAPGINTVSGVSATYSDRLSEQLKGYLYYALNRMDNDQLSRSVSTQSYGSATEIVDTREQQSHTRTIVHNLGELGIHNTLQWDFGNKRSRLSFRPIFKYEVTEGTGLEANSRLFYEGGDLSSTQTTRSVSNDRDRQRSGQFVINGMHRFKNGHSTSLHVNIVFRDDQKRQEIANLLSQRNAATAFAVDSATEQQIHQDNRSGNWSVTQSYTLPVAKTNRLTLSAKFNQVMQRGIRDVFDQLQSELRIDSLGSHNRVSQHQAGLSADLVGALRKTWNYTVGGEWLFLRQSVEDNRLANRNMQHQTAYFAPSLNLGKNGKRFRTSMIYNYRVIQPTLRALDPIPDYRRPELTIYGNPDLKANLFHNLSMTLTSLPKPGTFVMSMLRLTAGYHTNRIVQDISLQTDANGLIRQQVYYRNLSGDMELTGKLNRPLKTWEFPKDVKVILGTEAGVSAGRERYYEAGAIEQSFLSGANVQLSSMHQTPKYINMIVVGYNVQHNTSPNSIGMGTIQTLEALLSLSQTIWKDIHVTGLLRKSFNWGYQGPANRDPFAVNLTLQGNVYKTNVTWTITANDLLDQSADQGRTVSRNQVTDYYNNIRGRYVVGAVTWRLGKFGGQW